MSMAGIKVPIVVIIGPQSEIFSGLRRWLSQALPRGVAGSLRTIPEARDSSLFATQPPDQDVVLPDYSDQFSPWVFSPLLCPLSFIPVLVFRPPGCYSAGCPSCAWPVACRTESGSAEARIMHELQGFLQLKPPLSPIAAAEEVFALHAAAVESATQAARAGQSRAVRAFVMSADVPLRTTLQAVLRTAGVQAESGDGEVLAALLQQSAAATPPELLFVDLDGLEHLPPRLIEKATDKTIRIAALTGFPGIQRPSWADELLDKNEFSLQATSLLRRWSA